MESLATRTSVGCRVAHWQGWDLAAGQRRAAVACDQVQSQPSPDRFIRAVLHHPEVNTASLHGPGHTPGDARAPVRSVPLCMYLQGRRLGEQQSHSQKSLSVNRPHSRRYRVHRSSPLSKEQLGHLGAAGPCLDQLVRKKSKDINIPDSMLALAKAYAPAFPHQFSITTISSAAIAQLPVSVAPLFGWVASCGSVLTLGLRLGARCEGDPDDCEFLVIDAQNVTAVSLSNKSSSGEVNVRKPFLPFGSRGLSEPCASQSIFWKPTNTQKGCSAGGSGSGAPGRVQLQRPFPRCSFPPEETSRSDRHPDNASCRCRVFCCQLEVAKEQQGG